MLAFHLRLNFWVVVGELVELFLPIYYVKYTTTQVILAISQSAS